MIQHPRSSVSQNSRASRLLAAITAFSLSAAPAAYAANTTWVGNTDANFSTLANWNTLTPNGNTPIFGVAGSSGTTLNNDLSGATFNGITYNSGASAFTLGGNSFTLAGNVVNNSTSTQTINTPIVISGARQFNATSGQLVFGGNITGNSGSWTLNPTNKITLGGTNSLTMSANFAGFIINAGAGGVDITGSTTITGAAGNAQSGYMNIAGTTTVAIKSGGSLTVNGTTNTTPGGIIGQNAAGTSTLSVENGGSVTFSGNQGLSFGNNRSDAIGLFEISGNATVNAGSTTATDQRSFITLGRDSATGTVNLNSGGVLATGRNFIRDGSGAVDTVGAANFNFKGGTLKALAAQADWLNSSTKNTNQLALSSVTTTSAASAIDSNGFTVGINNAITGSGGFHITDTSVGGTGVVNFGGASYAYTGATSVDSGAFNTNVASIAFSGNLAVAGGTLTLNGAGTGSVSTTGFSMSSGTWTVSIGDTVSTSGNMSITGGVLDAAAFAGSEATYSTTGYALFTSIGGTGLVSGLSITGYDTTNYFASLSNAGVLTFAAIPEPSAFAALVGLAGLGFVASRRRRSAAPSA